MINLVRATCVIVPGNCLRQAECFVNGCGEVFRALRIDSWIGTDGVGFADDSTALNAASGQKDRLSRSPVISPRCLVVSR